MRRVYERLLIPAFETGVKRRQTFRYLRELEASQWRSRAELEAIQFEALRTLIAHAFASCPFYREEWQERGLGPDALRTPDDIRRWPLVERETIRLNRAGMRSQVPGLRLLAKGTGGSSGTPLQFDLDTRSNEKRMAAAFRGYRWAGAGPGTRQLYLWGVSPGAGRP